MKQSLQSILSRQNVERIVPPLGFWKRLLMWIPFIVMAWLLLLLMCGGVIFWLDTIAEWVA